MFNSKARYSDSNSNSWHNRRIYIGSDGILTKFTDLTLRPKIGLQEQISESPKSLCFSLLFSTFPMIKVALSWEAQTTRTTIPSEFNISASIISSLRNLKWSTDELSSVLYLISLIMQSMPSEVVIQISLILANVRSFLLLNQCGVLLHLWR